MTQAALTPSDALGDAPRGRAPSFIAAIARFVRRAARERTVQFFVLGGLAFALAPRKDDASIHVSRGLLETRRAAFAMKLGEPVLSAAERTEVDRRALEDEVLYREALRLGLDRDDAIVKQHLIQKMLLLAEDLAGASRPATDAELRAFFDRTRERRVHAARLEFVHVFARSAARAEALGTDIADAAGATDEPPPVGDAFPLPRRVSASRDAIVASYGESFAAALETLPLGVFSDPIASRYGYHLVRVTAREPARPSTFEESRDALRLELDVERRQRAVTTFLERAFARYRTDVDGVLVSVAPSSKRTAARTAPSEED